MTVRTFISTTEEALKKCRKAAIKTVEFFDFEPVTIESWTDDSQDLLCVCCQIEEKIKQEISLYIGIFAYCYGDIPSSLCKSVIEKEFNAAVTCKTPILAFIPNPLTKFAAKLQKCAAKQGQSKHKAQRDFIERIYKAGDISTFTDENDFIRKITYKMTMWREKGLRNIAVHKNKQPIEIRKKVFISYTEADWDKAKKLYDDLKCKGIEPWIDKEDLLPGERWKKVICQAIKTSSHFLVLLSSNSVSERGHAQKELKIALDLFDEFPESETYIIPVLLDDCNVAIEKLHDLHYIDLFLSYDDGLNKILRALKKEEVVEK